MNELPPGELPLDKPAKAHCGWFAVSEEALRIIERTFDREGARRKAKACFITLLRIANLEGSNVFVRSIAQIAKDMSYGYSEAAKAPKACRSHWSLHYRTKTSCRDKGTRAKPVYSFNPVR